MSANKNHGIIELMSVIIYCVVTLHRQLERNQGSIFIRLSFTVLEHSRYARALLGKLLFVFSIYLSIIAIGLCLSWLLVFLLIVIARFTEYSGFICLFVYLCMFFLPTK